MAARSAAQKMLIKPGHQVRLVAAPRGAEALLGGLPEGAKRVKSASARADAVIFFAKDRAALLAGLPRLRAGLAPDGLIWILYRKGSSPMAADLNRDSLHALARAAGLEGVTLVSVDDDWSAMRFKFIN